MRHWKLESVSLNNRQTKIPGIVLQNRSKSDNSLFIFSLYVFAKKKAIFSSSSLLLTTVNERLISSLSTEACIEKQSICEHKFTKHREKKTFFHKGGDHSPFFHFKTFSSSSFPKKYLPLLYEFHAFRVAFDINICKNQTKNRHKCA